MTMKLRLASCLTALAMGAACANATPISYTFSSGSRSAAATFDQAGSQLIVTLTNTSQADVMVPGDVLTAVYFDLAGDPGLFRTSAVVATGSNVYTIGSGANVTPSDRVVGGEWAYVNTLSIHSSNSGISSSGLGLFGPGDRFPGSNLQGPDSPDGIQYGITSAGDNLATGNGGLSGNNLIKNSVVFVLSGYAGNPFFDISDVTFQYGTGTSEPSFPGTPVFPTPEPATLSLLAIGVGGLLTRRVWRARSAA